MSSRCVGELTATPPGWDTHTHTHKHTQGAETNSGQTRNLHGGGKYRHEGEHLPNNNTVHCQHLIWRLGSATPRSYSSRSKSWLTSILCSQCFQQPSQATVTSIQRQLLYLLLNSIYVITSVTQRCIFRLQVQNESTHYLLLVKVKRSLYWSWSTNKLGSDSSKCVPLLPAATSWCTHCCINNYSVLKWTILHDGYLYPMMSTSYTYIHTYIYTYIYTWLLFYQVNFTTLSGFEDP